MIKIIMIKIGRKKIRINFYHYNFNRLYDLGCFESARKSILESRAVYARRIYDFISWEQ
jgi:hypothetical protein